MHSIDRLNRRKCFSRSLESQKLLQSELELHKSDLDKKWHLLSLEKIFIEHKIYRLIEDAESWEVVVDIIMNALLPFENKLKTKISNDDIIYLTDLKIKRISKYDINKTKNKLLKLEHDLDEVINNIDHITDYTILFYERLLKKYGENKNRKS